VSNVLLTGKRRRRMKQGMPRPQMKKHQMLKQQMLKCTYCTTIWRYHYRLSWFTALFALHKSFLMLEFSVFLTSEFLKVLVTDGLLESAW